jgi:subtilisin family serine protease
MAGPKKIKELDEEYLRKLQPRLRVFADGSREVNEARSEQAAALRVCDAVPLARRPKARRKAKRKAPEAPKTLVRTPNELEANVFVHLDRGALAPKLMGETARQSDLAVATVRLADLAGLVDKPHVAYVEAGNTVRVPPVLEGLTQAGEPKPRLPEGEAREVEGRVLVGIIDVGGFDFAHPDFIDAAGTRFHSIWDQAGTTREGPDVFGYGSLILKEHMDAAIAAAPGVGVGATDFEPQESMSPGSHGTHVASIAAGNAGVCPFATIVGVCLSLPEEDWDRRRNFADSTRIAHAIDYILGVGKELGLPVSINISLGTNGGAHDGSGAITRWIDNALAVPGRCITVAAGNAGQEGPEYPDDVGYIMGRIHAGYQVQARGLDVDLEWVVVGNGMEDVSENELEIWYGPADRFVVQIKPPNGDWLPPVRPGEYVENTYLEQHNSCFVSIYNELYHPSNGSNYIAVHLSPYWTPRPDERFGVQGGVWTVRIHGDEVRDGGFHAWIERDDPRRVGRVGDREHWNFPSFFTEESNVDRSQISSLACGRFALAVANLDAPHEAINKSSSQGPTRDGRDKPDVAAPGTDIVAARGFDEERPWVAKTGTSMAAPYVTGVTALMLATEPRLTAAQVQGILRRTSHPLPGHDYHWRDDAGYGRVDAGACVDEAARAYQRKDLLWN